MGLGLGLGLGLEAAARTAVLVRPVGYLYAQVEPQQLARYGEGMVRVW